MPPFAGSAKAMPLLLAILLCRSCLFVVCLNKEGAALLSFKQAISYDPSGYLNSWNSSDDSPCSWWGVSCRWGSVISISLSNMKLVGFIPAAIESLPSLRHINFRNNMLHGSLPADLFDGLSLESLVLSGNSLSGPLPALTGEQKCLQLQVLDLSDNSFNGSFPDSLLQCRKLKILDLGQNRFSGTLPDNFGASFGSLEMLNLSRNGFNGSIPSGIGGISSLKETVDLSHNRFSGRIPKTLGNLPERIYVDLSYNDLNGSIPQIGGLVDIGPLAFAGNPGLCGQPLKIKCPDDDGRIPSSSPPSPSNMTNGRRSLNKRVVISIVAADVVGIGLMGLVFFYCYMTLLSCKGNTKDGSGPEKGHKERGRDCSSCFRVSKDVSDSLSEYVEAVEQFDLVPLDMEVRFNLDELLKASAFVLGKGRIGIVYKVVLEDGLAVAVRRLGEGGLQRYKEFQAEVEAIGKMRHPNVVTLRAYYWSFDEKLLIYDYIPNGNLDVAIHGQAVGVAFSPLSWDARLKIIKGIAKGLVYLHESCPKKYVHGDLKPTNILLRLDMEPCISDFGLGRLANIAGGSPDPQTYRITPGKDHHNSSEISVNLAAYAGSCYQAPEALKLLKPSQKWDVYSYGVILLELLSGRSPVVLMGNSEMDLVRWFQFCIEEKKPFSEVLDPSLAEEPEREDEMIAVLKVALACVQANPERRPMMRHVSDVLERFLTSG